MGISEFWNSLTDAQATVLASLITITAALLGVVLGSVLFGGRVNTLERSLSRAEELLEKHRIAVTATLADIQQKLITLDEQAAANISTSNQILGNVIELPESGQVDGTTEEQRDQSAELRAKWNAVRDELESEAANLEIDGRTRAKYSRIDRRSYPDLIAAMKADGLLRGTADLYSRAVAIWHVNKNGRRQPSKEEISELSDILARIRAHSRT